LCPCRRDTVFVFEFVHLVLVLSPVETRLIASLPPGGWNTINRVVNRVLMPGTIVNDFDEMGIVETRLIASLPPGVGIR
jgi:hypothetical protein